MDQLIPKKKKVKVDKDKELFESRKEALLNEHKQELEKEKEIFYTQLEAEQAKKLEAKIDKLLSSDSEINAYALLSIIKKRLNDD